MGDFRKLIAWQKAHALSVAIHKAFRGRGSSEFTGLRGQIMRAAGSTADNLVEGCSRRSQAEFERYADQAHSSSKEVEGQLLKARDVGAIPPSTYAKLSADADEVSRLCWSLSGRKKR